MATPASAYEIKMYADIQVIAASMRQLVAAANEVAIALKQVAESSAATAEIMRAIHHDIELSSTLGEIQEELDTQSQRRAHESIPKERA